MWSRTPCPATSPNNKKGRVSLGRSRPGSRNLVRLLTADLARARLAGPPLRKGEAVGKGEIARVQMHHALSAVLKCLGFTIQPKPQYTKRFLSRQGDFRVEERREDNCWAFYFCGRPKLRSASLGTTWEITSTMYLAGVIPAKSAPGRANDCNPMIIARGSPALTSAPGGNKGSKLIGEPLVPGTRLICIHQTRSGRGCESDLHRKAAISFGMLAILPNLKIG